MACSTNAPSGVTAAPSACSTVKSSNAAGSTVPSWAASAYMPTWVVANGTVVVLAVAQAVPFQTLVVMVSPVRCSRSRSADDAGRSAKPTAEKVPPASRSVSTAIADGDSDPT